MTKLSEIQNSLVHHSGTSAYHQGNIFVKNFFLSDGTLEYCQKAECFYMVDKLATEMVEALRLWSPDTYYLTCTVEVENGPMVLEVKDYQDHVVWKGGYDRCTHPVGVMKTVMGWDGVRYIWCLHSEN